MQHFPLFKGLFFQIRDFDVLQPILETDFTHSMLNDVAPGTPLYFRKPSFFCTDFEWTVLRGRNSL